MGTFFIGIIIVLVVYLYFRNKDSKRYEDYQNEINETIVFPHPDEAYSRSNRIFHIGIILVALISFFMPNITLLDGVHIFGFALIVWGSYFGIKAILIDVIKEKTAEKNNSRKGKLFFFCFFCMILGMLLYHIQKLPF